jgi:hypothetical protein
MVAFHLNLVLALFKIPAEALRRPRTSWRHRGFSLKTKWLGKF